MASLPEPGTHVGEWIVERWVAAGASADVLRVAHREHPGSFGALKWFRDHARSHDIRDREAGTLRRLDHPGVVQLLDIGETDGAVWLVTSWADGRPLDAIMSQPLTPDRLAAITLPIAAAVAHAHRLGLVHGDLKPANVRVDRAGRTVVLDFGSAQPADAGTRPSATPRYAPPEWFGAAPADGRPADVYALGVIMQELASGEPAFPSAGLDALAAQKRRGPVHTDPSLDSELAALIRACTAIDPADRPSVHDLCATLDRCRSDSGQAWFSQTAALAETRSTELVGPARYTPIDELGRGGMGVVWRAWDEQLMRYVALKRPPPGIVDEARFAREAQLAARLEHPGIARIFNVERDDDGLFYTMELIEGITLRERLSRGVMHPHTAASVVGQLASAVEHAHQAGLIHRDIKPANVMIEPNGRPRLVDFGLARPLSTDVSQLTRTGELMGTPAYMAPEQIRGEPPGPAMDVYALGAILYQSLTGESPHQADSAAEVLHRRTSEPAVRARLVQPTVPPELEAICAKALELDPALRFATAGLFADELQRFVDGRPVRSARLNPARRAYRWARRNGRIVGIAIAAVCGLILVAGGTSLASNWLEARAVAAREGQAAERYARLQPELASLRTNGQTDAADSAFDSFVTDPDTAGTDARVQAWLDEADRLQRNNDLTASVDATARAWMASASDRSLIRVAAPLQRRLTMLDQTDGAAQVGDELLALVPHLAQDPAVLDVRQTSLLLDRRMAEAAALQGNPRRTRLAAVFSRATRTDAANARYHPYDHDGDGRVEVFATPASMFVERGPGIVHAAGPTLPQIVKLAEEGFRYTTWGPRVMARAKGRQAEVKPAPDQPWQAIDEPLSIGRGIQDPTDPKRSFLVQPSPARLLSWSPTEGLVDLYPEIGTHGGELAHVAAADFIGDPRPELLTAPLNWGGFELDVLVPDDDGPYPYRVLQRLPFGFATGLEVLRRGDQPPWAAVTRSAQYGSRHRFPTGDPYGGPTGLLMYEITDGGTEQVDLVPRQQGHDSLLVADLDGDGWDEAYANSFNELLVYAPGPDGASVQFVVAGLTAVGAADLDQNGDDELLVLEAETGDVWVLGLGGEQLPGNPPRTPPSAGEQDILAVHRAVALGRAGLRGRAAREIAAIARSEADAPQRDRLITTAATLFVDAGQPQNAEQLLREFADRSIDIQRQLSAHLDDRGRKHEAAALRGETPSAAAGHPPWTISFDQPTLHEALEVRSPFQARRLPDGSGMAIDGGGEKEILAIHLDPAPRHRIEIDVTVTAVDWDSLLELLITHEGDRMDVPRWFLQGRGGARLTHAYQGCLPGHLNPQRRAQAFEGEPRQLRVILRREHDQWSCSTLDLDTGLESTTGWVSSTVPGDLVLHVDGRATTDHNSSARAIVHRITVEGAPPRAAPEDALSDALAALANRNPQTALEAMPGTAPPLVRAIAASEAGQEQLAEEIVTRMLRRGETMPVAAAIRTERFAWMPLVKRVLPHAWPEVWAESYMVEIYSRAPHPKTERLLVHDLAGLEQVRPRTAEHRHTVVQLLMLRADALIRAGEQARARRALARADALSRELNRADLVARVERKRASISPVRP